jgi:hypothetical protein
VLRVGQGGALLDGVIIDVERGGAALLVAIACRGRLAGVSNGARSAATSYRCASATCLCRAQERRRNSWAGRTLRGCNPVRLHGLLEMCGADASPQNSE